MGKLLWFPPHAKDMSELQPIVSSVRISEYNDFANDLFAHFNRDQPEQFARSVLECIRGGFPVPISQIAKNLGFGVYTQKFDDATMSGYIGCKNYNNKPKRVISVNSNDSTGHQRFTIAHELWHFFDNFERIPEYERHNGFFDTYITTAENLPNEQSANRFARNLLMPEDRFISVYNRITSIAAFDFAVEWLSDYFGVSKTAVLRRKQELIDLN